MPGIPAGKVQRLGGRKRIVNKWSGSGDRKRELMATLKRVLMQLRKERDRASKAVTRSESAIAALTTLAGRNGIGRSRGVRARRMRPRLSVAARKRIAAAQRARWAKVRAKQAKKAA